MQARDVFGVIVLISLILSGPSELGSGMDASPIVHVAMAVVPQFVIGFFFARSADAVVNFCYPDRSQ